MKEPIKEPKKKGTISGAVALIIGTSIGSGILALPQKASPAVDYPPFYVCSVPLKMHKDRPNTHVCFHVAGNCSNLHIRDSLLGFPPN